MTAPCRMGREGGTIYARLVHFAERLNRFDSLTDTESLWLEDAMKKDAHVNKGSVNTTPQRRPWLDSDIALLREFLNEGKPVPEFAPMLGRKPPAIHEKMRELGLRRRPVI